MKTGYPKQRGVALLIVLLVVALVSILAVEMGARLQLQLQRTATIKDSTQAYWYAIGAEEFARTSLKTVLEEYDTIHLNQPWANQNFQFPLPGGGIEAKVSDGQACFNLNSLQMEENQGSQNGPLEQRKDFLQRLVELADPDNPVGSYEAEVFRDGVTDWVDTNDVVSGVYGAEDSEYEGRQPPYLTANAAMANKSELRLINGADPRWLRKLMPLVCARPGDTQLQININTIDESAAPLLAAALGLSNVSEALDIINARPAQGFDTAEAFLSLGQVSSQSLSEEQRSWFNVTTDYFILRTRTRYNDASFVMTSLMHNKVDEGLLVVRREFGGIE